MTTPTDELQESLLRASSYLEIVVCDGTATHLQTPKDQAFPNWATYADILLTGGELADIRLEQMFPADAHWIRCGLVTKSDLETDFKKAVILAEVFLACPHTITVQHEQRAQSQLILPAGVKR